MDYDKIVSCFTLSAPSLFTNEHSQMVLDAGRLVEYDSPRALLGDEGSFFRALVEESADKEALYAIVEGRAEV